MNKPNITFFVIGAARSGTTSLFRCLSEHPGFFTSPVKEPRFFNENWKKGWDWYSDIYLTAKDTQICGDFSPSYSTVTRDFVAKRISWTYPNAKFIYLIRNPIDCAISNWRMTAEFLQPTRSFGDALHNPEWKLTVMDRCRFFYQIEFFRRYFPDDQIRVYALEDIKRNLSRLEEIQRFIGLSPITLIFPRANASERKIGRPPIPNIPRSVRHFFIDSIKEDSRNILEYAQLPHSFWPLSPNYKGWEK